MKAEVEDFILARLREALTGGDGKLRVRTVAALPGPWTAELLARIPTLAPAVLLHCAGGRPDRPHSGQITLVTRWLVYLVTGHAQGDEARRRGDGLVIGGWELSRRVAVALNGLLVPDEGSLVFEDLYPVWAAETDDQALTCHVAAFRLPMPLDAETPGEVDEFLSFDVTWDLAPADESPEAQDLISVRE